MADNNRIIRLIKSVSAAISSADRLTWMILGGGFSLGILSGAIFLFGSLDATDEPAAMVSTVSQPHAETSDVTPHAVSPAEQTTEQSLAAEREKLQRELEAEKLRREVETLRRELVELKTSDVSTEPARPAARPSAQPRPISSPQTLTNSVAQGPSPGDVTLNYWNRLNAIILQEAALRSAPVGGVTAGNAAGFLDSRIRAAQFAIDAIQQLDTTNVDARVLKLSDRLSEWYADAREVAETGRQLLTTASIKERQGSAGKMYQAAEHRHAEDVNEINDFGEQVRQEMSGKYERSFPPLN